MFRLRSISSSLGAAVLVALCGCGRAPETVDAPAVAEPEILRLADQREAVLAELARRRFSTGERPVTFIDMAFSERSGRPAVCGHYVKSGEPVMAFIYAEDLAWAAEDLEGSDEWRRRC